MDNSWQKDYPLAEGVTEEALGENHSLKKILRLVGENKRVVDFGCATGYLAQLLNKRGCVVTGVEINVDAAKVAEQHCKEVIVADLDFVSVAEILPKQEFDIAVFGDVLEHLRNPWKVLKEVKQLLSQEGHVVASIPNIAHGAIRLALLQGRFEYTKLGILDNTHLRFFTRNTIEELFEESGYFLETIDCTTLSIFSDNPLLPNINKNEFNGDVIKQIELDENAEVLQFIVKAFPLNLEGKYAALNDRFLKLQEESKRSQVQLYETQVELERSHSQLQETRTELERSHSQLQEARTQLQETQTELERSQLCQSQAIQDFQNTITAMESSKFWKARSLWFQVRDVFGLAKEVSLHPSYFSSNPLTMFGKLRRIRRERGTPGLLRFLHQHAVSKLEDRNAYKQWLTKHQLSEQDIASAKQQITQWQLHPKFSVIMPVYNTDAKWLERAIESVRSQVYTNWELCIADDASTATHVRPLLTQYTKLDSRIKVTFRSQNANISAASNSALELATGEYIALLDHDDELAIDALFENAKLINAYPNADFIYSDEDKIDTSGNRLDPFFKPDWSPDYFHGCMYTCHLGVYRTTLIRKIGGFRSEYDGAQDYDLVLRVVEETKNIYHIPKVLYHWRIIPTSVTSGEQAKPWAFIAAQKALEAMLERSPYPGHVETGPRAGFFRVRRHIIGKPLISIIIPSAGQTIETANGSLCLLENCLRSIQQSTYSNFEVIVVDGYDIPKSTLEAIAAPNLHLVRCSEPFNFSMRINRGTAAARGKFLLLLNDDTEVITPDWLESMLELAQQQEIGAVGAKLLYPDDKIQHAGVMVLDGNPGHAFHRCESDHPGYFCSNIINRNYLAVTGACLMIRAELFHQVERFDEEFPLNYNDVDFCLKVHQAGYRNVVTSYVQLIHYESASRQKGLRPGEWEKLNNKWKNYFQTIGGDPYYNPNLSTANANFELF